MSAKWNLIVDVERCSNCNNCVLAAKDELVCNDFPGYSVPHPPHGEGVIRIERHVRGAAPMVDAAYVPRLCNHCDDAPCVKAGGGAVKKRDDGIVIIDPVLAKGRRDLVDSCPYGAIVWNEAGELPQNWFFDAHLLDAGWRVPRCVGVCPTQAIEAVKTDDATMARRIQDEELRPLRPEFGTKPRVYYRNLYRADGCFVGGSVTVRGDGRDECVADAEVTLSEGEREVACTRTDVFGDFRFDRLSAGGKRYRVVVKDDQHGRAEREVQVDDGGVVLGEIELRR